MRVARAPFLGVLAAVVSMTAAESALAQPAIPGLGDPLVLTQTGEVQAQFSRGGTGRICEFYLDSPANNLGLVWSSTWADISPFISLGTFSAGTELVFKFQSLRTGFEYPAWYTGPGDRNSDGWPHAGLEFNPTKGQWRFRFETDAYGGDMDYDDAYIYVWTVPEPTSILLLMFASCVLFVRRRC